MRRDERHRAGDFASRRNAARAESAGAAGEPDRVTFPVTYI